MPNLVSRGQNSGKFTPRNFEKLFALRESRRGNWRQAVAGLEAQMREGSEARRI